MINTFQMKEMEQTNIYLIISNSSVLKIFVNMGDCYYIVKELHSIK